MVKKKTTNNHTSNTKSKRNKGDSDETKGYSTPYDDVFRTLIVDCRKLMIPIVNEIFNHNYEGNEQVILKDNEIFLRGQDNLEKRITDSSFLIVRNDEKTTFSYHLECQSSVDHSMIIRVYEYDSQIALKDSSFENGNLRVRYPNSAIIYLRTNSKVPDISTLTIETPGGKVTYPIPSLKIVNYSIEEIFDKNLLFLIPFHFFVYESELEECENNGDKLRKLTNHYSNIMQKLEELCLSGKLDEYTQKTICEMSKTVIEHLASKYETVKKEVLKVMGGKILDYEAKTILMQGKAEGLAQGKAEGENKLGKLIKILLAAGDFQSISRASEDEAARKELYKKYNIID